MEGLSLVVEDLKVVEWLSLIIEGLSLVAERVSLVIEWLVY